MKVGDTVTVVVYETLAHQITRVLEECDFAEDGSVDVDAIETSVVEDGIDWNACEVTDRETWVYPLS